MTLQPCVGGTWTTENKQLQRRTDADGHAEALAHAQRETLLKTRSVIAPKIMNNRTSLSSRQMCM